MKKISSVVLAIVLVFCAVLPAFAQELEPYQDTEQCCYVLVGGTYDYQQWDFKTSYKVQDESIATVDENGVIHGLKAGSTSIHVVVFDEKYSSWFEGGYSFDQDICVYEPASVLSLGSNIVEGSATFTPEESGYYSFKGNADMITVSDGAAVEYHPSALYHDDTEYFPMPDCYLEAGVPYTVSVENYDDSNPPAYFTVTIKKSVPVIVSALRENDAVELYVEDTFLNDIGDIVFCILRKTADSDYEIIGYLDATDNLTEPTLPFMDADVAEDETYIYTVKMVDAVDGTEFLSDYLENGVTVTPGEEETDEPVDEPDDIDDDPIEEPAEEPIEPTEAEKETAKETAKETQKSAADTAADSSANSAAKTGDSANIMLFAVVFILSGTVLCFFSRKKKCDVE